VCGAVVVVNVYCRLFPVPVSQTRRTIRRRSSLPAVPGEGGEVRYQRYLEKEEEVFIASGKVER
jgi:hypothetical protein